MANHTTERDRAERPTDEPLGGAGGDGQAIDEGRARRAANLFDLRRLIGGLFLIYGAILTVLGIGASDREIEKAAGINLNLWVGLSLLVVGALFLLWAFARPLSDQLEDDEGTTDEEGRPDGDRTVRGAPAPVGADAAAFAGSETTSRRARRDRTGVSGEERFRR
jgi:hypothetical protein